MKFKRILISGGAGFIGSHLALALRRKGCQVTVLDNLSRQVHGDFGQSPLYRSIQGKVHFIRGDVRDKACWLKAIKGQDAVVHLAADTGTGQSMYEMERYVDVNVRGTAVMLDALSRSKHQIRKLVVASSRAVYGEGKCRCSRHGFVFPGPRCEKDLAKADFGVKCPVCVKPTKPIPTDEESKLQPISVYGSTKRTQEELVLLAGRAINVSPLVLRYQNVYGPGQSMSNPYTGILSVFSTRILNGNNIEIYEDGVESRDFVFIEDVVAATILALENRNADGEVFNIGSGVATDVMSVAKTLIREFKSSCGTELTGRYRAGDIRHNVADLTKVRKFLGFIPKFSFQLGVREFVCWARRQRVEVDQYANSRKELSARGLFK